MERAAVAARVRRRSRLGLVQQSAGGLRRGAAAVIGHRRGGRAGLDRKALHDDAVAGAARPEAANAVPETVPCGPKAAAPAAAEARLRNAARLTRTEGGGTGFESVASGGAAAGILRLGTPLGAQKRPSTFRGDWDDRNSA